MHKLVSSSKNNQQNIPVLQKFVKLSRILLLVFLFCSSQLQAQISGNITVGNSGADFTSLTNANGLFDSISRATLNGDIFVEITSDLLAESGAYALQQWNEVGVGNYRLYIRPDGNTLRTIEGDYQGTDDSDEGLYRLDSVSRVCIDGRDPNNLSVGGRYLLFRNTQERDVSHPAYYYRSTFNFINGSHNDTLRNIIVEANTEEVGDGIIHFGNYNKGNYNILVDSCYIRSLTSDPTEHVRTGIYSYGVSSSETNHDITISNNHFINIWDDNGNDNHGIYITGYSTDFTISGNHFYLNATRDLDANVSNYGVYINTEAYGVGDNFIIKDNFFGGSAPYCGGAPWSYTDGNHHSRYTGIKLETKDNSTGCIIENNKINNFEWYQYGYDNTPLENLVIFSGIQNGSGNSIIRNNIIGAPEGTDSISLYCGPNKSLSSTEEIIGFRGIWVNKGDVIIDSNTIGAIKSYPSVFGTYKSPFQIEGIHISKLDLDGNDNTGDVVVKNNIIGSITTPRSIETTAPAKVNKDQLVIGIYLGSHSLNIAKNNIIANMHNGNDFYYDSQNIGVLTTYDGQKHIINNKIFNLTNTCYDPGYGYNATIVGIKYFSNTNTVDSIVGNEIYNLKNLVPNDDVGVCGIGVTATSKTADLVIARNNIHSLSLESSDNGSTIYGIHFYSTRTTVKNNMIRLGIDADGNSITDDYEIVGISQASNSYDVNYNTVYIGGNVSGGVNYTTAFQRTYGTSTTDLYNNIFINERSNNGGTASQYAVILEDNANVNSDYNLLWVNGTNGVIGNLIGTDYATLGNWQTAISDDYNSISGEVFFVDKSGPSSTVDLHIDISIASIVESAGTIIAAIPIDIDLEIRYGAPGSISSGTAPDIGADEIEFSPIQANATITPAGPFCEYDSAFQLTAVDTGGVWSGNGVDPNSGIFDPFTAGVGNHQIIYTISGPFGDADTIYIDVIANADATISPAGPFCSNDAPFTLSAVDGGGTWSGNGVNATTGVFDPQTAGVGTHEIIYSISNPCGDADTIYIEVIANADATISPAGPYCSNDAPVILYAVDTGGVWSGNGVNASTGVFNPQAAGIGIHQIIYTISGLCGDADSINIEVLQSADASITHPGQFCISDAAVILGVVDTGGVWSGNGVNASTGVFDPQAAGVGTHQIIYTISGICGDADTINISVINQHNASITSIPPICSNEAPIQLITVDSGGTWTGSGVNSSGIFNPSAAGAGTHQIIYSIADPCGDADTIEITVHEVQSIILGAIDESCNGAHDGIAWVDIFGGTQPYSILWNNMASTDTIAPLSPGWYAVNVTDSNNCLVNDSIRIYASTEDCIPPHIYIPNIFSPNGDGNNDILFAYGKGIEKLSLIIYNRWGGKVFETTDIYIGWDGSYKGKMLNPAVFVYYLEAELSNGENINQSGNISLIK